jgi:hypothetical protein
MFYVGMYPGTTVLHNSFMDYYTLKAKKNKDA